MKENGKYRLLQGSYWALFCTGYGYVTYFLMNWGYTAGEVGIITAVFGALAALLQPLLGRLADRGGRFGWKPLLLCLASVCLASAVGLCLLRTKLLLGILYGLLLLCLNAMMPLVNAASFYYQSQKIAVDFGVARGVGSLCYAVTSLLLGRLTALAGAPAVPLAGVVAAALVLAATLWLPYHPSQPTPQQAAARGPVAGRFLTRYPTFTIMLAGLVLLLAFHNITNTYLYQMLQAVGGDSNSLGTALAIAAVMELPVMFGFSHIIRRCRAAVLLAFAGCIFTAKAVLFLCAGSVWLINAAQLLQMLSFALFASASVYYAEQSMAPADKVSGQAWMSCTITAGAIIGNLTGGWVLDVGGVRPMLWLALAFAAVGAVIVCLAAHRKEGVGG